MAQCTNIVNKHISLEKIETSHYFISETPLVFGKFWSLENRPYRKVKGNVDFSETHLTILTRGDLVHEIYTSLRLGGAELHK